MQNGIVVLIILSLLLKCKLTAQTPADCSLAKSYALFTSDVIITVPRGVSRARVLLIGGGGGGGSGPAAGGAAGYVNSGVFNVNPNQQIQVIVGKGGQGSTRKVTCDQDSKSGGASSFRTLVANGGGKHQGNCPQSWTGPLGGTGGGGGCYNSTDWCQGGQGGSGGSSGGASTGGSTYGPGTGQGSYSDQLQLFCFTQFTAGAGGNGAIEDSTGGGGAGGVLVEGDGPQAGSGESLPGSQGGRGYGAGGGSGGYLGLNYNNANQSIYYAGGAGSDGLVYVEWFGKTENCTYAAGFASFTSSGLFIVPCGVQQVRVLVVGGGSGGLNGHAGGGCSGYVHSGTLAVSPLQWISVTVGTGGAGSSMRTGVNNQIQNSEAGGTSSFGALLSATGGAGVLTSNSEPFSTSGGSGAGQGLGCFAGSIDSFSGAGGSGGSSGFPASGPTCSWFGVGKGQGPFSTNLQIFTRNVISAGLGGKGNKYLPNGFNGFSGNWYPGGGGGGGVLFKGTGPNAQDGQGPYALGFGGIGYGAGGGAGGLYWTNDASTVMYAGGRGADGLVYIEW